MDHPISSSPDSSLQLPLPPLQEFALELSDLDDEVRTLITEAHQNPSIELSTKARASTFPYITGDEDSPLYNDAYAASSLILARQLTLDGKFVEALRALDLGMLRGGVEKWAAVYREVALAAQNGICRPVIGDVDQDAPKSKKARSSPPLHFGSGEVSGSEAASVASELPNANIYDKRSESQKLPGQDDSHCLRQLASLAA